MIPDRRKGYRWLGIPFLERSQRADRSETGTVKSSVLTSVYTVTSPPSSIGFQYSSLVNLKITRPVEHRTAQCPVSFDRYSQVPSCARQTGRQHNLCSPVTLLFAGRPEPDRRPHLKTVESTTPAHLRRIFVRRAEDADPLCSRHAARRRSRFKHRHVAANLSLCLLLVGRCTLTLAHC